MRLLLVSAAVDRVVVVGASGFVGRNLADQLGREGMSVLPLASKDVDLRASGAAARLAGLLRPTDALVMCSALTPEHGRDAATLIANVTMAKEACEALLSVPPASVVYLSSDGVYSDIEGVTERTCAEPTNLYGLMHLTRERVFRDAAQSAGFPLKVIRPCAVYGPGDTHGAYGPNRFARTAIADGTITLFGKGEERRDHVFVRDLCRVIIGALVQRSAGLVNVGTGTSVTFMDVARGVARVAGRRVEILETPRAAGSTISHRSMDVATLRAALPGLVMTPLEDGLRETVAAETS